MSGSSQPIACVLLICGLVVHGDVAGIDGSRRNLSDWLDWMGFIDAGFQSRLDRYIGYYEPSATSHVALDKDTAFQDETRNVARAVAKAVAELRADRSSYTLYDVYYVKLITRKRFGWCDFRHRMLVRAT